MNYLASEGRDQLQYHYSKNTFKNTNFLTSVVIRYWDKNCFEAHLKFSSDVYERNWYFQKCNCIIKINYSKKMQTIK